MKEELLKKLKAEVELFSNQKESNEYKESLTVYESVEKTDVSSLEAKVESHVSNGANAWLTFWGKNGKFRIYINCIYKNGFKPNFNPNFVEVNVNL